MGAPEAIYPSPYRDIWFVIMVLTVLNVAGLGIVVGQYAFLGHVVISGASLRLISVLLAYFWILRAVLVSKFQGYVPPIFEDVRLPFFGWLFYSIISFLVQFFYALPTGYVLYALDNMMFIPLLLLVFSVKPLIPSKIAWTFDESQLFSRIVWLFYVLAIVIWPLGFAQFITNRILLPQAISGTTFQLLSVTELSSVHIRASSFLESGAVYGQFSLFIVLLSLGKLRYGPVKKRWAYWLFLILGLTAAYSSYTRSVWIDGVLLLIAWLIFGLNGLSRLRKYLPFWNFSLVVLGMVLLYGITVTFAHETGITNSSTLLIRYQEWAHYTRFVVQNPFKLLFGYGLIQSPRFPVSANIIVDSTPIAIVLYQGIFGLGMFLYLYVSVWRWLLKTHSSGSPLVSIMLVKLSVFWAYGLVSNMGFGSFEDYIVLFCIFLFQAAGQSRRDLRART